ncbi:MAG: serpin family protein [Thermostichus sp. DG02_3_bins_51]
MPLINPLNWPYRVVSRIPLLVLLSLLLRGSRSGAQEAPLRIPFEPTVTYGEGYGAEAMAAQRHLHLKLLDQLLQQRPQENLLFSPLSIHLALSMVYNGASGDTQAAMAKVLAVEELSLTQLNWANAQQMHRLIEPSHPLPIPGSQEKQPQVQVRIANGLWVDQSLTLQPQFLQASASYYQALVNRVDLGSQQTVEDINTWVADRTEGKIDRLVERLSREDLMVLLNAIYFKGEWSQPFDPARTQMQPFTRADGSQVEVPMMARSGRYGYLETEQVQVVRLPYGQGELEMVVLLPRQGVDPETLRADLTPETWAEWTGSLPERAGSVQLPRFSLAYETDLVPVLEQLGMGIAFSNQADFTALTPEPVRLSRVVHKAVIEVNEEGSEAAAATGVILSRTSIDREEPFQFVADRPFWFAIKDSQTQAVLFMGAVADPQPNPPD